ncbi:retropepsin-like aspartic protease [Flavobacterium sp. S87F.05.LMB.W.Kidney.N]|uniref:retropepsin-like aspartic protease n=1 Tax=Flavobacterium sp. S87F.05.LMB.W.Kidney.N TaxID=1278758 RepID=UPI00106533A8|nr:retropepsin-like aspartic protease [Flavobacterium sp. S87F.05.LMB.W.Kidney.N]TDX12386.1 aspartyl protease [Flavobacterium sp. S87F.05.LMB.W.Kidney.N]
MKNIFLFSTLIFGCSIYAQNSIQKSIETFEKAFKDKDYSAIKNLIAPEFTVGSGDSSSNEFYFNTIFKAYPNLDSIQVGKSKVEKNQTKTAVNFFFTGKEKKPSEIVFNSENKMVYVTFFDGLYRVDRNAEVKKLASIPFQIVENGIAIKIKLNKADREFLMLFDTGADGMALNPDSAYKAGVVLTKTKSASVVGGSQEVKYSADNTIYIGDQVLKNQGLVIFPKHGVYDGLFGANLLRNYITSVNFDTMTIDLYNFGNFNYWGKAKPLVFDYKSGLPVVKMNLTFEDKKTVEGSFTFDTGAGYDLIAYGPFNHKNNLEASLKTEYTSVNYSLGKQTKIVGGAIPNISINGNNFSNVTVALQEYDEANKNWAFADGSLGIDLIKRFNFTIDLLHKTVYLEPNKNFNKTPSFYLSGLDLDFDEKQHLLVKRVLDQQNEDLKKVKVGAKVTQINDFEAKDLAKPENLKKLKETKESKDIIIEQDDQSMRISI